MKRCCGNPVLQPTDDIDNNIKEEVLFNMDLEFD